MMHPREQGVFYANLLWTHPIKRLRQLSIRRMCIFMGHNWRAPRYNMLHCSRPCGGMKCVDHPSCVP